MTIFSGERLWEWEIVLRISSQLFPSSPSPPPSPPTLPPPCLKNVMGIAEGEREIFSMKILLVPGLVC